MTRSTVDERHGGTFLELSPKGMTHGDEGSVGMAGGMNVRRVLSRQRVYSHAFERPAPHGQRCPSHEDSRRRHREVERAVDEQETTVELAETAPRLH